MGVTMLKRIFDGLVAFGLSLAHSFGVNFVVDASVPEEEFQPGSPEMADLVARAKREGATVAGSFASWQPEIELDDHHRDALTRLRTKMSPRIATAARAALASVIQHRIFSGSARESAELVAVRLRRDETGWYEIVVTPQTRSSLADQQTSGRTPDPEVTLSLYEASWRLCDETSTGKNEGLDPLEAVLTMQCICDALITGVITLEGLDTTFDGTEAELRLQLEPRAAAA